MRMLWAHGLWCHPDPQLYTKFTQNAATLKAGGSGESAELRDCLFHYKACQRREGFESHRSAKNVVCAKREKIQWWIQWWNAYIARWPHPFWWALAGFVAIGNFLNILHKPMAVQLHCIIKKGFSLGEKNDFYYSVLAIQYEWSINRELCTA